MIQIFDSWAGHLEPAEFDEWASPYQQQVVKTIKERHPEVPVIIYMAPDEYSRGGALLEKLAASGADVVSIDHTIEIGEAKKRLADAGYPDVGLQGNMDPELLRDGSPEEIVAAAEKILAAAGDSGHVMNLGHGIEVCARLRRSHSPTAYQPKPIPLARPSASLPPLSIPSFQCECALGFPGDHARAQRRALRQYRPRLQALRRGVGRVVGGFVMGGHACDGCVGCGVWHTSCICLVWCRLSRLGHVIGHGRRREASVASQWCVQREWACESRDGQTRVLYWCSCGSASVQQTAQCDS